MKKECSIMHDEELAPEEEERQRQLQNLACLWVYEGALPRPTSYPRTHLLNPAFEYTPSHKTDIRKTFERVRREQQK